MFQCYGVWDGNPARAGAGGPVGLFEPTANSATDVNYDVSLVSGYNTQITVTPSIKSCYAPTCVSDLNQSCPANLQVTEQPSDTPGPIPCGKDAACQSGACVNNTCVIACNDPSDQCVAANPPAGLMCDTVVPGGDGSTFADMYFAKNFSGKVPAGVGITMASGNQGTPTCWGDVDCAPGESCKMGVMGSFPAGVGVCPTASGAFQPQIKCASQSDVGNPCGGYQGGDFPNALGYDCVSAGAGAGDVACVPAFNPATSGLGRVETATTGATLFSGTGSPVNPEWLTAATTAGNGAPWYEAFANACPHQYGWQYDDHAGGLDCNSGAGGPNVNMTITFGP
ncbi:MAG: thaumatin family protein [Candidatus Binataceae bacterium]